MLFLYFILFFFNDTATTEIYTLSLHDALPISMQATRDGFAVAYGARSSSGASSVYPMPRTVWKSFGLNASSIFARRRRMRSEEHTSELQSQSNLVCRLLLEKKKKII